MKAGIPPWGESAETTFRSTSTLSSMMIQTGGASGSMRLISANCRILRATVTKSSSELALKAVECPEAGERVSALMEKLRALVE